MARRRPRLSDGKAHPVTVRHVDPEPHRASSPQATPSAPGSVDLTPEGFAQHRKARPSQTFDVAAPHARASLTGFAKGTTQEATERGKRAHDALVRLMAAYERDYPSLTPDQRKRRQREIRNARVSATHSETA